MKKYFILLFLFIFLFAPLKFSQACYNCGGAYDDFTFRSTVLGEGVRNPYSFVYEIAGETYDFDANDEVYALTRIFNIRNLHSFQFKQVLYSDNNNNYKTLYSPVYRPNGSWWAETYSWVNFGELARGHYNLKSYISVNGGYYKELSQKDFRVGSYYNNYDRDRYYDDRYYDRDYSWDYRYDNNYNDPYRYDYADRDYYDDNHYYGRSSYDFDWLKVGLGVNNAYGNAKTIAGERDEFENDETIYTLVKLSKIKNIEYFRIKQEVYDNSNNVKRRSESNVYRPNNSYWSSSYIENKIGTLPEGDYRIKTYIKIENGSYKYIDEERIEVEWSGGYDRWDDDDNYYHDGYDYEWTHFDNRLKHDGGYKYSLDDPKTVFYTNENVVVLTKLSDIRNVDSLQVKHEFFKDGRSRYKTMTSPERRPNGAYWDYNYNYNNFGTMPVGNHEVKVFIKINNGSWKKIDEISVKVKAYSSYSDYDYSYHDSYYDYDWTKAGSQISATY